MKIERDKDLRGTEKLIETLYCMQHFLARTVIPVQITTIAATNYHYFFNYILAMLELPEEEGEVDEEEDDSSLVLFDWTCEPPPLSPPSPLELADGRADGGCAWCSDTNKVNVPRLVRKFVVLD